MSHAAPKTDLRAAGLLAAYLLISLGPLGLSFTELMPGRGFWINFSIALGFVALSVLGLQFALTSRNTQMTRPFGIDAVLRYHRHMTLLAVGAAFGHPLILFVVSDHYLPLLDFVHAPGRAKLAWIAVIALAMLIATSMWRKALRLSYEAWHALHTLLGLVCVLAALGHALLVHYYTSGLWVQLVWIIYGAAFLWISLWVRLIKPLQRSMQPWRVAELWPEPGGGLTLSLEPAFRGGGFTFKPGQFAWVLPNRNPLTLSYHPFSMSSSALAQRLAFTIKPAGGFAEQLRGLRRGDRVYLDGPHGNFTLVPAPGYVFLATGVGVTPFLSMLATMADQGDHRPVWLFLGNRHEGQIMGIRQLARLADRLPNLTMVNVISRPSEHWAGARGHISSELVREYLPEHYRSLEFYLCGRNDITESLRTMLRRDLRLSGGRIHAEDFQMV